MNVGDIIVCDGVEWVVTKVQADKQNRNGYGEVEITPLDPVKYFMNKEKEANG